MRWTWDREIADARIWDDDWVVTIFKTTKRLQDGFVVRKKTTWKPKTTFIPNSWHLSVYLGIPAVGRYIWRQRKKQGWKYSYVRGRWSHWVHEVTQQVEPFLYPERQLWSVQFTLILIQSCQRHISYLTRYSNLFLFNFAHFDVILSQLDCRQLVTRDDTLFTFYLPKVPSHHVAFLDY